MRFLLALLFSIPALAELSLSGAYQQGGFMIGRTEPGSVVVIGDNMHRYQVPKSGYFIYGLGRKEVGPLRVEVRLPDGRVSYGKLPIEIREFAVQHVKGVPQKTVTPDPKQVARSRKEGQVIRGVRERTSELTGWQEEFVWPVSDTLSGFYGSSRTFNGHERSWHKGVDVAAPTGTPIIAPASGQVRHARDTFFNGNLVMIDHGAGLFSIYAHMDEMSVTEGQMVQQGDVLGTVGSTGRSTGPHLHWGIYWHQVAIDPILWLTKERVSN